MKILKKLLPVEFDTEKQEEEAERHTKRADVAKERAKKSVNRFEASLLELEVILKKNGKDSANGITDAIT